MLFSSSFLLLDETSKQYSSSPIHCAIFLIIWEESIMLSIILILRPGIVSILLGQFTKIKIWDWTSFCLSLRESVCPAFMLRSSRTHFTGVCPCLLCCGFCLPRYIFAERRLLFETNNRAIKPPWPGDWTEIDRVKVMEGCVFLKLAFAEDTTKESYTESAWVRLMLKGWIMEFNWFSSVLVTFDMWIFIWSVFISNVFSGTMGWMILVVAGWTFCITKFEWKVFTLSLPMLLRLLVIQKMMMCLCVSRLLTEAYNNWDQTRRMNAKSKQNPRRRCWIRKHWYPFTTTKFHSTETLGFKMLCVRNNLSYELLAKHTNRIKRSLFMGKENNKVKILFADKSLLREASSTSLLLFYRLQQMAYISAYVIICFSEILSIDFVDLWLIQICIITFKFDD